MTPSATEHAGEIVAAVDVGSNTIKMTVARWDGRELTEVRSDAQTVRLSAGIEQTGTVDPKREAAALTCLNTFAANAREVGATVFIGVATEVLRAAANGAAILARIEGGTPWRLQIISGEDEAALTYAGVRSALDDVPSAVIADIGGGSTELIAVSANRPAELISVPIGSGKLTDRLIRFDPPESDELERCRQAVGDVLDEVGFAPPTPLQRLLITGGTGLYLGALVGGESFAPAKLALARQTLHGFPSLIVSEFLGIPPERAHVLPAGVAVVEELAARWMPGEIAVAESGVRRGLLLRYFRQAEPA